MELDLALMYDLLFSLFCYVSKKDLPPFCSDKILCFGVAVANEALQAYQKRPVCKRRSHWLLVGMLCRQRGNNANYTIVYDVNIKTTYGNMQGTNFRGRQSFNY